MDKELRKKWKDAGIRIPEPGEKWQENESGDIVDILELSSECDSHFTQEFVSYHVGHGFWNTVRLQTFVEQFSPTEETRTDKLGKSIKKMKEKF